MFNDPPSYPFTQPDVFWHGIAKESERTIFVCVYEYFPSHWNNIKRNEPDSIKRNEKKIKIIAYIP